MTAANRDSDRRREALDRISRHVEEHRHPAEPGSRERLPSGDGLQALIEQRIEQAMAEGKFDNLPGQGKPLALDDNPYLEPGQLLAFNLLQRHGFSPEWIERDKAIRRELEAARAALRLAWQRWQHNPAAEPAWRAAQARFEERLHWLNSQIDDFNLIVPILSAQRPRLVLAAELQAAQRRR